jgi:DNA-binding beta-propeller fold protein YncE
MSKKVLNHLVSPVAGLGCVLLALAGNVHAAPLTAGDPILLPGTKDGFDFIRIDTAANRLLLGHEGNKTFDVFDLDSKKLLKAVPTSTSQDATTDVKRGNYYVSGNDPGRMVIVDSKKLEITGEVPVPTNTDLIGFNPQTGLVYECNDAAGEVWVIEPAAKKIVTTIKINGTGMEDLAFDPEYKHLYLAVKGNGTVAVIDPASHAVTDTWSLAPDKGPHGIAIVPENDGLLVACAGKLVLLNRTTGKIAATAATGARVDEMAYDPGLHIAYCASRSGKISAVAVEAGKLTALGDVPDETGTGDIVVDPKTHTVWIAYHKGEECFVQPFTPAK